ncbi:MAG: DUF3565 domain-containing protein [Planctomycetes bacterium]|nr:DUF3565 domain-containing protein [Planctomycetota bacterium]
MRQPMTGFHQDHEGHWVARLACGHTQHVRHQPPMSLRPWVLSEAGRAERLGGELDCLKCERGEPRDVAG